GPRVTGADNGRRARRRLGGNDVTPRKGRNARGGQHQPRTLQQLDPEPRRGRARYRDLIRGAAPPDGGAGRRARAADSNRRVLGRSLPRAGSEISATSKTGRAHRPPQRPVALNVGPAKAGLYRARPFGPAESETLVRLKPDSTGPDHSVRLNPKRWSG